MKVVFGFLGASLVIVISESDILSKKGITRNDL